MSPAERRFWLLAQRRVAGLQPDVAASLLRAFAIIRENMTEAELARAIQAGRFDQFIRENLSQQVLDRAFIPYRHKIRHTVERGFQYATRDLPKGGKVDGVIGVAFDYLSPNVVVAIRQLDTKVIQTLSVEIRDTVRAYVENGIRDGKNPRVIARDLRAVIGMSPTQVENAAKYRAKLEAQGKLPEAKIDKAVAAYEKKAVALNAETNARTATLDAFKQGQKLSWDDAIARGIVDVDTMTKTWVTVGDDRVRDSHLAMQGETVPYNSPYSNGQQVPGEDEYNCRCVSRYAVARQSNILPRAA